MILTVVHSQGIYTFIYLLIASYPTLSWELAQNQDIRSHIGSRIASLFTAWRNRLGFEAQLTNQNKTRIRHRTPIHWPVPANTSSIFMPLVKVFTRSSIYAITSAIIENGRRPAPRSRWRCGQLQQQQQLKTASGEVRILHKLWFTTITHNKRKCWLKIIQ